MWSNEYHFVTRWRVRGTVAEVSTILGDATGLSRWWPSVYLDVQVLEPSDERGIGKVVALHTRGWLPYTLRWQFRVTDVRPDGYSLEAGGDFVGRGVWRFEQRGSPERPWVLLTYDWRIRADKPLLRLFSPVLRPLFAWNHRWAMRQGERSLRRELAHRRANRSP